MLDGLLTVVPAARVGPHRPVPRSEDAGRGRVLLQDAGRHVASATSIVLDPMLATGNSAVAAVERLKEARPRSIRFVCLRVVPRGHPHLPRQRIRTCRSTPRRSTASSTTTATSCRAWATPATASSGRSDARVIGATRTIRIGRSASSRNATLPDGRTGIDVLVADGRIVNVSPRINAAAARPSTRKGYLLTPPFVDAHFHMDATLSYGLPRVNAERHAARRHRAVGRAEAAAHAGRDRRARARLLRLGGREGPARDPLARRRVRPAPARRRGAPAREGEGEAVPRPAARRVSAGRRAAQSPARSRT